MNFIWTGGQSDFNSDQDECDLNSDQGC